MPITWNRQPAPTPGMTRKQENDAVRALMDYSAARARHRDLQKRAQYASPAMVRQLAVDLHTVAAGGAGTDEAGWATLVAQLAGKVTREADKVRCRHQLAALERHAVEQGWAVRNV